MWIKHVVSPPQIDVCVSYVSLIFPSHAGFGVSSLSSLPLYRCWEVLPRVVAPCNNNEFSSFFFSRGRILLGGISLFLSHPFPISHDTHILTYKLDV